MTSAMKHGGSPTRAAQVNQERSTSPLFAPEPSYFYPYARPESAHLRSSKESESKASLSLSSNDRPLSFHGAVRDLKELRALYVPFISSEEDLTPSSSNTANYIQSSSIVSVPSSQCRLPQGSAVSVTSRPGSSRQSFHMGKFTPPARINARSGRLSKSSLPIVTPASPASKTSETERESVPDILPDASTRILEQFVKLINSIDMQSFSGEEKDLVMNVDPLGPLHVRSQSSLGTKSKASKRDSLVPSARQINFSSTVYNYGNSQLPSNLPHLRITLPIWPILCLAAQFSQRAYSMPSDSERETFVEADVKGGTNAMVIKSVALDHIDLVVLSIRGTMYTSFKDWASNMTIEPQSPAGFLDNSDNLCHAGFLGVARQLIKPVASRLRQILRDNPSRSAGSLVITGHSTGGAIASLLYAHMLSQNVKSDLINLRRSFNRIHCVSFGAPPVSAQPLNKPTEKDFQNWLFFSIINEGDPVTLAERPYVRSLIDLYNTPPPPVQPAGFLSRKFAFLISRDRKKFDKRKATSAVWSRPAPKLTLPGGLIILRGNEGKEGKQCARAYLTRNEELARVVFGDVSMHSMALYQKRVESLATEAAWAKLHEAS
uniref:Fungal lipase-type domain-containing protein n=1 Tax=Coccidioides posadasii RMSCC 3488 TaxID=454284 RepID=A0A0J6FN99_COCPO|nr:hypothetical protein CPAG_07229 [Coccidioides posadasii RMSCC 3488]